MPGTSPFYRGASLAARGALALLHGLDAKLARGHRGRTASLAGFRRWAAQSRDRARPLVWFHAPSVGEGLQASAVITRLRARHPDWQLAYTWFSPSAEAFAGRLPVDVAGYLPYDLAGPSESLLDALQPTTLVFSKLDLWPELATRAAARGVKVALIAATVRPGSGRLRWPVRALLSPGYQSVAAAGAIADDDATRLGVLGVPAERIQVLGDPRFDSVAERVAAVAADDPLLAFGGGPVLVAGSTWPGDEAVLLGAFRRVRERHEQARLILVPHEPTPEHLGEVEHRAAAIGLPAPVRLSAATAPVPLMLVDRVGVLAALYGAGTMAFVGGGFHSAGLHSVLEPAAWGRPVAFGPRWQESRDAGLLVQAAGARAIATAAESGAVEEMTAIWCRWIEEPSSREREGSQALSVVRSGLGAADRTASLVERLTMSGR